MRDYASLALRLALGLTFLDSVADRFGLLGAVGAPGVAFGTFARFAAYVEVLNSYVPHVLLSSLARVDTVIEVALGVLLIAGLWLRVTSAISALLLLWYGIAMGLAVGLGAPFQYSVFTASAGAFLLACTASPRWSIDSLISGRGQS